MAETAHLHFCCFCSGHTATLAFPSFLDYDSSGKWIVGGNTVAPCIMMGLCFNKLMKVENILSQNYTEYA